MELTFNKWEGNTYGQLLCVKLLSYNQRLYDLNSYKTNLPTSTPAPYIICVLFCEWQLGIPWVTVVSP